ncbi:DEAD/DEAH box helicase [Patescibacteria group bacterium]|nr:DEAD/DEAH box helicase [Patescibacteria group bacterium]
MNFYQKKKMNFDFSSKTKPLEHQIEATEFVKIRKEIPLFDEQGLGKSKIVIDALCDNMRQGIIDSVLIICKKTLLKTWEREIFKHSHLRSNVISGARRKRGRSFMHFSHFHIINYESVSQELEKIKVFLGLYKFAIVLDESTAIKNPQSKTAQSIFEIKNLAIKKIIITGTPLPNRPEDLWSQFYFLDDGKTLGSNFKDFKSKFYIRLKGEGSLRKYEHELSELRDQINKVSIRRTKSVLELPEKIYTDVFVTLDREQKIIYEDLRKKLYVEIKKTDGSVIRKKIENYLVKLLRLTQIASNPGLIDESYNSIPVKFRKLDSILKEILKDEKAIVWSSFRRNIRTLKKRYQNYGAQMLFGEMSIDDRNKVVDKFMNDEECKLLIANPAAAKEGLTLTAANNAIYLDRSFKMDDYIQSQDRIHRIGQEKKCKIIKIIAKDTIDEYTDEILQKKFLLAQFTLGDIKTLETKEKFLTKYDLLKILG